MLMQYLITMGIIFILLSGWVVFDRFARSQGARSPLCMLRGGCAHCNCGVNESKDQ